MLVSTSSFTVRPEKRPAVPSELSREVETQRRSVEQDLESERSATNQTVKARKVFLA